MRQALLCVTHLYMTGGYQPNAEQALIFFPAPVLGIALLAEQPVRMQVSHFYEITQDLTGYWSVHTTAYSYTIEVEDGPEVVSYHYDPHPEYRDMSNVYGKPHLHVRGLTRPLPLSKAHFPTDRIALESFLLFAIRELGVYTNRPDAVQILEAGDADFQQLRSW